MNCTNRMKTCMLDCGVPVDGSVALFQYHYLKKKVECGGIKVIYLVKRIYF